DEHGGGPGVQPHPRGYVHDALRHGVSLRSALLDVAHQYQAQVNRRSSADTGPSATEAAMAAAEAGSASSAITGHTGLSPQASTAAGFHRTTGAPASTGPPSSASSTKPPPSRFTVSIPRCTSTPRPSVAVTTKACGLSLTRIPEMGLSTSPGSRTGSIAAPGPTMAGRRPRPAPGPGR